MKKIIYTLFFLNCFTISAQADEIFLDSVVASVNGRPITLSDIETRLRPKRKLSFSKFSDDSQAKIVLEQNIAELLLEEEAKERNVSVDENDVDSYVNEVAAQNNMSIPEFKKALAAEKIPYDDYRRKVQTDILKSKLASVLFREGAGVTEDEIDNFIKENPNMTAASDRITLRQIFLESETEADKVLAEIKAGKDFENAAKEFSKSPDSKDGGLLGSVSLADLSPSIQDAIILLKAGEISKPVKSSRGVHLFQVVEKSNGSTDGLRDQIRARLEKQKMEEKIGNYFANELLKKHSVDKKV